jgi:hypothetical protein
METEPNDFRDLRRLLALKRHECPPPGYFDRFSAKVVARLEAQRIHEATPLWRRWLSELIERPALTGLYFLLFGGLGMISLGLIQTPMSGQGLPPASVWAAPAYIEPFASREVAVQPVNHAAILQSSVSPVVGLGSPFVQPELRVERASFHGR